MLGVEVAVGVGVPVMVGVGSIVALLHPAQVAAQLAFVQLELLDMTCLAEEVEGQQGQRVAGCGFCQPKDVKLPVLVSILHSNHVEAVKRLHVLSEAGFVLGLFDKRIDREVPCLMLWSMLHK